MSGINWTLLGLELQLQAKKRHEAIANLQKALDDLGDLGELASIYLTIATRYRVQVTGEDPGDARDAIIEEARGGN